MAALAVGIHSIGSAGDLNVYRWDAASLDGVPSHGGDIGVCGGVQHNYQISLFAGGAYFATAVPDADDLALEWAVFKLDVSAGTCARVLTIGVDPNAYPVNGVACSEDGQKVFVKHARAGSEYPLMRSLDGGQSWVEVSTYSGGYSVTHLMFDSAIDRLFHVGVGDGDAGLTEYSDDLGATWTDMGDPFNVASFDVARLAFGLIRGSLIVGGRGVRSYAFDAGTFGETEILLPGQRDVYGVRGAFAYDEEVENLYYIPATGGSFLVPGYPINSLVDDTYSSPGGDLCFENPDGTLCGVTAPGDWNYDDFGIFVIEASAPTNLPFWRNFVGAREIP